MKITKDYILFPEPYIPFKDLKVGREYLIGSDENTYVYRGRGRFKRYSGLEAIERDYLNLRRKGTKLKRKPSPYFHKYKPITTEQMEKMISSYIGNNIAYSNRYEGGR